MDSLQEHLNLQSFEIQIRKHGESHRIRNGNGKAQTVVMN